MKNSLTSSILDLTGISGGILFSIAV